MENEIIGGLVTAVVGLASVVGLLLRRNGKAHNNPGNHALGKLETLSEQQVDALRDLQKGQNAIQVTLGKMEQTVGNCAAVQAIREKRGA